MTGMPDAIASSVTLPKVSTGDGKRRMSDEAYTTASSSAFIQPMYVTLGSVACTLRSCPAPKSSTALPAISVATFKPSDVSLRTTGAVHRAVSWGARTRAARAHRAARTDG